MWQSIGQLEPLRPNFVSVTYGANGSDAERSHATVERLVGATSLTTAAHVTCVGQPRATVDDVITRYWQAGVRHIVALRGDPAGGVGNRYEPHPGGYRNAADLVAGIKRLYDAEISVSAYPEKHPESPTVDADLDMLKAKVDAGATRAITQFFFDNDHYLRYVDRVRGTRHRRPDRAGHHAGAEFRADRAASRPSAALGARPAGGALRRARTTIPRHAQAGRRRRCHRAGPRPGRPRRVTDFHFYTMNRADLVYAICQLLGLSHPVAHADAAHQAVPA